MKKYTIFFLLALYCLLPGCSRSHLPAPLCRVVTQVDVFSSRDDIPHLRSYTATGKVEAVLLYLRLLKPLHPAGTDADSMSGDVFTIRLQFSDGTHRLYRQKSHRYIARDDGPWLTLEPELAADLYRLLRSLPSDHSV